MKPTIATLDLVLNAAKSTAQSSISKRDLSKDVIIESVTTRVIDTKNPPWILFEVLIIYHAYDKTLEPNDDLSILVPWNSDDNSLGKIQGKSF
jgi:hypothetical protein